MKIKYLLTLIFLSFSISGCSQSDDNDKPIYGPNSGLPVNCRAYVQLVIDEYRAHKYTAEESMTGLERNCGINGWSWKNNREK